MDGAVEALLKCGAEALRVVSRAAGFMKDGAIGIPDEARPEKVKTMADSVREYRSYA